MNFVPRTATLLACASLFAPAAFAQKSELKRALPPSTLVYMSMPDIDTSIEEFLQTPLAKIWREKDVQDFFADAMKMLHAKVGEGMEKFKAAVEQGQSPLTAEEILGLRIHGASFAFTGIEVEMPEGGGQPRPDLGVLVHLNFGSSAKSWKKAIDFGMQMAEAQAQGMLVRNETKVGEFQAVELAPQIDEVKNSLCWSWMGESLLLGTRSAEFKSALTALGGGAELLSASPAYQTVAKRVDAKGAELEMYMGVDRVLDVAMNLLEFAAKQNRRQFPRQFDVAGVKRALEALGMRSMKSMGFATRYENGRSISESFVACPEPERRGLMVSTGGSLSTAFLKWVPKDSTGFDARKLDFHSFYDAVLGAVRAYSPDLAAKAEEHLAEVEKKIGFKIQDDLFGAFGDELIWWSMPMASIAQAPDLSLLVKMRDDQKFLKVLKSLVDLSDGAVELDDVERGGQKMHILKINAGPGGGSNPLAAMLVPTFAFKNGYMVGGLSANSVKKLLERMDRPEDPKTDIRANPEVSKVLTRLPQEGLSAFAFTDWKVNMEGYYQLLTTGLAFLPLGANTEIPIDLSLLPEAEVITKHMFGSVSWSTTDANGFHNYSEGPFGPEVMIGAVAIGAGAAGVMAPQRIGGAQGGRGRNIPPPKDEDEDEKPTHEKKPDPKKKDR